jgi:predicted permease
MSPRPASSAPERPRSSAAVRLFRVLLSLYPGEFRDEYGREMAMVFADRHRAASTRIERTAVWIEALWGLVTQAPKEHIAMLTQDLRHGMRGLGREPTFAITVILTLALGIGANIAVFQLIDAVRLRTLPVRAPEELAQVRIAGGNRGAGITNGEYAELTRPMWEAIASHQRAFSGVFAWGASDARVGEPPELRRAQALYVSDAFFDVLGLAPWGGRLLGAGDGGVCPPSRSVVSHRFWNQEFGGGPWRAGQRMHVNGAIVEIVGVTGPGFTGLAVGDRFDVALPLCQPSDALRRELFDVAVMGRLRPGWSIERASAHLDALSRGIFEATAPTGYQQNATERFKAFRLAAYPGAAGVSRLRETYDRSLWLLLGMTALVLLMASANLANLMLARASTRDREVSVRLALGASRTAIARQILAECALLAAAGAAAGALLAQLLSRGIVLALATQQGGPSLSLPFDWIGLGFTAAVAAGACLIFGIAPVLRATRLEAGGTLQQGTRGASRDRTSARTQRTMVAVQVAASVVLLVGALLFVRSFHRLLTFDPGIRRDGITVALLGFDTKKLPPERWGEAKRALAAEIASIPGVIDAATTTHLPLLGSNWHHGLTLEGVEDSAGFAAVGPAYFRTMGQPMLEGRPPLPDDTRTSARVAVVNQAFVRRFTPGRSPIGRTLRTHPEPDYPATSYAIVGVTADTNYNSLRGGVEPMVYVPDTQYSMGPWAAVMIHAHGAPADVTRSVKARLRQNPSIFIADVFDFEARVRDGLVRERLLAMLAGFFGVLAALIAAVGIYGMVSYGVTRRRREIGIRAALGAGRGRMIGMVMQETGRLFVLGALAGGGLAMLSARSAESLLFGLRPEDPLTLALATGLLALGAAVASYLPARRASRVDPIEALRQE